MLTIAPPALLRKIFDIALQRFIQTGSLNLAYPDGQIRHYGPEPDGPTLYIHTWVAVRAIALNPSLGLLDGFTAGDVTTDTLEALEQVFDIVFANRREGRFAETLRAARPRPLNLSRWQRRNIGRHYDGQPANRDAIAEWYRLVLGDTLLYTCARFGDSTRTLSEAQRVKVDNLAAKLGLKVPQTPAEWSANGKLRLVDIGCGWGFIPAYLAYKYGVRVLGITIAEEQIPIARQMAATMGVEQLIDIQLISFQELGRLAVDQGFERFDAGYSVGMFEHVPHTEYNRYFRVITQILKPEARFMLHCITNQMGGAPDPSVTRRIFEGSRLGSRWQIGRAAAKAGLFAWHEENIGTEYIPTLACWIDNHIRHRERIIEILGEDYYRHRLYWMVASKAAFGRFLGLTQIVFTNGMPTQPWSCHDLNIPSE